MDIQESVQEILGREETVTERFYDVFLKRHPDLQPHFGGVDFDQQAVVLMTALSMIELQYTGKLSGPKKYLQVIGERHDARGIPQDAYAKFADCLVETLADFHGENWSSRLEQQWRAAIDQASELMLKAYRDTERTRSQNND